METKPKRIAIATSKGGVGKTTIATNLAAGLARRGRRVLLVDCDAQGNLQNQFHIRTEKCLVHLLLDGTVDVAGVRPNLDLINSGKQRLAEAELSLSQRPSREKLLAERLQDLNGYDFVFCDLSPTITLVNAMALHFCDYLLVPVSMSFYAITGAIQILETVEADPSPPSPGIQLLGLVLNCFDARTHLARMVADAVREKWRDRVFDTVIRKNVSIEEAPSQRKTIFEHAPASRGAEDFELLTDEFLRRLSL